MQKKSTHITKRISNEWQTIFHHYCLSNTGIPKAKLITQKSNFLTYKHLTEEVKNMTEEVKNMVKDNKCPIQEPLGLPNG